MKPKNVNLRFEIEPPRLLIVRHMYNTVLEFGIIDVFNV